MSRAYQTPPNQNQDASLSAILASHLQQDRPQHMDGRQPDYPQSGLSSPYASYNGHHSEGSSADQASAVQYQPGQDYKSSNFSSSATPNSDYGLPQTARSGSFPEYIQRSYADGQQHRYSAGAPGGQAGMAQTSSPSLSMQNGRQSDSHSSHNVKSDGDVPIDPSIAQSSPTYPPPHNYSPYPPQHEMPQYPGQPMAYGRPDWAGQQYQPMAYGHSPATSGGGAPGMVAHTMPRPPAVSCAIFSHVATAVSNCIRRAAIHFQPCILSSQFRVRSSTNALEGDTKRSRGCINVDGMDAKKLTEH